MSKQPQVHLIDDDDETVAQITEFMTERRLRGRRFASLVVYLDWLDYEHLDEGTVILSALELPILSGLDLLDVLHADGISVATILMSRAVTVTQAVEAMHAGAGYLLKKPFTSLELEAALEKASAKAQGGSDAIRRRFRQLSPRQRQLLKLVFAGRTNRQIAATLSISPKTVELHRSAMMEKMGADTLVDLIRLVSSCNDLLESSGEPA